MQPSISWVDLGPSRFEEALELQRRLHAWRRSDAGGDLLLLTEHEPVLTLGRGADLRHLRVLPQALIERGIALIKTERGGDVTYHGPGQLVVYPILDLRWYGCDVHLHVRRLEETSLRLLSLYGLSGHRMNGTPGVWVGERKIASVGVYVSRWVTMHGIAINIDPDLAHFDLIDPCGLAGTRMTSIAELQGTVPSMPEVVRAYVSIFAQTFGAPLTEAELPLLAAASGRRPTAPVRPGFA